MAASSCYLPASLIKSTATIASGSVSPSSGWRRTASSPPFATPASGNPWTPCATRSCSRSSGPQLRRPGRSGSGSEVLAKPIGTDYRPQWIQGELASALASSLGCAGYGYVPRSAELTKSIRACSSCGRRRFGSWRCARPSSVGHCLPQGAPRNHLPSRCPVTRTRVIP